MNINDLKFQNEELDKKTKNMLAASAKKASRGHENESYNMGYNSKKTPFSVFNDQNHDSSNSTFRYESVAAEPATDELRHTSDNFGGSFSKKSTSRMPDPPEIGSKYEDSTMRKNINDAAFDIKKLTQRYNDIKNK